MSETGEHPEAHGIQRTGWAQIDSGETVELASPGLRLVARILDQVIVGALTALFLVPYFVRSSLTDNGPEDLGVGFYTILFLSIATSVLYEVIQIAVWGKTLGKRIMRIEVINAASGAVPGWGKSAGRWAVPAVPALVPILGQMFAMMVYLSIVWDSVYQGWHDKLAGTLVIRERGPRGG